MPLREKEHIGRYEILEEIGRGAMGVVFKGRDPLIGRDVAVKTITSGVDQSADLLERFYREARAAGGLQHPNIVTIYELAESGGAPFIAMEYLEGGSLEKIITRQPALPLATKLGYVVQTCRALDYAHRHGVIHRDVKPANIVVTRDDIVKVVDFGIARLGNASQTQTGVLLGTLAYMSPEQIRGEHFDARSDIWATGIVLYELITYQRPFTGENHAALLLSILQNEPPPIWRVFPECPVALERIIAKCLRKDEKERYSSMESLLKDVENLYFSLTAKGSKSLTQAPAGQISVQPAPTVLLVSNPIIPGVLPAGAAPIAPPLAPQPVKIPAKESSHPLRNAAATCALLTVIVLGAVGIARRDTALGIARRYNALGVVRRFKILALDIRPDSTQNVNLTPPSPAPPSLPTGTAETPTPVAAVQTLTPIDTPREPGAPATPTADIAIPAAASGSVLKPVSPLPDSIEVPLRQEQTFWDKATAYLQAGDLDDAETWFRDILTSPEVGHRWSDAAHYVDAVIPERRANEKLWAAVQFESTSHEPGHLLREVKALDELLALPGPHKQQARQMRDTVITQMIRDDARRNQMDTPVASDADQWQMTRLKNHFDELVEEGDSAALNELQDLLPKFKSVADAQGPLAMDARDYLNSLIPRAEKHIEDSLAATKAISFANGAYIGAVKKYDRAVATHNSAMLQDQVLPLFNQIAQSGGVRAKEAQRYTDVLIPAALQKSRQTE